MKNSIFIVLLGMVFVSGCALSSLQSANTVRPGDMSFFAAGTGMILDSEPSPAALPDIGVRFGLTDNMDAGVRLFGLGFFADLKYALFQSRNIGPSLAVAGGFGYFSIGDFKMYALDAGPIFSFKVGKFINPYVSAKYRRMATFVPGITTDNSMGKTLGDFITGSAGFELFPDSTVSLLLEGNRFFDVHGNGGDFTIYNIAVKLNF